MSVRTGWRHIKPSTPEPEYEPIGPMGGGSEFDMYIGLSGLLETCSGREDVKPRVSRDAEDALKMVRGLGGSVSAYTRERNNSMTVSVSEIYSSPRVTKTIQMMPSSEVLVGFALDLGTHDTDGTDEATRPTGL